MSKKRQIRLLLVAFLFNIAVLYSWTSDASDATYDGHILSRYEGPSYHIFIKGSGNAPFLERSRFIAETWGKDAAGHMTFMMDNHNFDEVEGFGQENPHIKIIRVNGTDLQGMYKRQGRAMKLKANAAQRLKTRAVFQEVDLESIPDWVCYLDDDMVVNLPVFLNDLTEKAQECSPNCIVADAQMSPRFRFPYTLGGWCMESDIFSRVALLLAEKSDDELGWQRTDDVDFCQALNRAFGIWPTNSQLWFSEAAAPTNQGDGTYGKVTWNENRQEFDRTNPSWEGNEAFMRNFTSTAAVYHTGFLPQ